MAPTPKQPKQGKQPSQAITAYALSSLITFSALMAFVPLGLFFAIKDGYADPVIRPVFGAPSKDLRMSMAAIFAVISVNVIVGGFVLTAFKEPEPVKSGKQD